MVKVLLSAGEPSGDVAGAAVAQALRRRWPDVQLLGLGGPRMAAAGVQLLADLGDLAVLGLVEVLGRLPFFWSLRRRLRTLLDVDPPHLVLPIDYPGLNLWLAEQAHRRGVPVLYYIAPQVWAWHAQRLKRIAQAVDRLAVVLPFEEGFFRRAGVPAVFVGHPLVDRLADYPRESATGSASILALLPGSRAQEVRRHLPLMIEAAARVVARCPAVQPRVARAPDVPASLYAGTPYPLENDATALLRRARAAIVKSGTSTLEAALLGVPFVVVYRLHPWTFALARRLVRVRHVALANLIAEARIAPEFLQKDANPERLADAVLPLLGATPERARMLEAWERVRSRLGPPGAADRVADLAAELLAAR